jgi:hypothetical protein
MTPAGVFLPGEVRTGENPRGFDQRAPLTKDAGNAGVGVPGQRPGWPVAIRRAGHNPSLKVLQPRSKARYFICCEVPGVKTLAAPTSERRSNRLSKNVASGLQPGAPGAQEPECTEGVHEDSEHRASPDQGRAVVFQQPAKSLSRLQAPGQENLDRLFGEAPTGNSGQARPVRTRLPASPANKKIPHYVSVIAGIILCFDLMGLATVEVIIPQAMNIDALESKVHRVGARAME